MKIVTSRQMREIERRSEAAGVSTDALMQNAGLAVAERVRRHLGEVAGAPVLVLVGSGNNGGDGLVMSRHLRAWGADVTAYVCLERGRPDPRLDEARAAGVAVVHASGYEGRLRLRALLASARLVVDAVLGTGRSRPIEGALSAILRELAEARGMRRGLRLLALDLPTGLDSDTGAVDALCPAADVTVALGYPKVGLFKYPGAEAAGTVETVDIGVPAGLDEDVLLELMTPEWAAQALPARPAGAHKGTFGRVLLVVGSRSYVGAAYLAAAAAARVGAGLVTLAVPEGIQTAVAAKAVEPTYLLLPESERGVLHHDAAATVLESIPQYDALLVGCGLGQGPGAAEMVRRLLLAGARLPPTVVDADGLNLLAASGAPVPIALGSDGWWVRFADPAVLTPHPGEMARLTGRAATEVQADRVATAVASAARWGKVVVLKGAYTVVAGPDGRAMVAPFANPGLASAGTGDVLAGAIVGLLSQGLSLDRAASLGVYLHGAAGERVREDLGDAGMIASDLLPELPRVVKQLRAKI